jgi:PD-(D/E)XK endonuclease
MNHPKDVGDRTTLAVMLALRELGFALLVPFGENTRYDLVIDDGATLARVQCKTGRLRNGAIRFKACSSYAHHPRPRMPARHYQDDVDFFAVHCPDTGGVYLIPIADLTVKWEGALRIDPPRNGQKLRVRTAANYEVGSVGAVASARQMRLLQ